MNVVIIEDEPRAANRLEKLILEEEPNLTIVKKLESVKQAVAFFDLKPEVGIIFSDIQLTDDLSFEIFRQIQITAPVIFTTAYDNYAINAFKANGIDYLLKPLSKEDVANAIQKFKTLTKPSAKVNLSAIAELLASSKKQETVDYKSRFMVKVGQHIKSVSTDDIVVFYSKDKTTFLFTKDKRNYPLDQSLDQIHDILNPAVFFKISRSFIVNLNGTSDIMAYSNSRLRIVVEGLDDELIVVAREKTKEFKAWLGE
jgi:DNA-binding LytR/AlgR family response regulator